MGKKLLPLRKKLLPHPSDQDVQMLWAGIALEESIHLQVIAMKEAILTFLSEEDGLTTVEYAVAATLITLAVVASFTQLAGSVNGTLTIIDGWLPG